MKQLLLTALLPSLLFAFSGSGTGTEMDPYQITTVAQLQEMNNGLSSHYRLMNDIDASETATWNVGDHDGDAGTPDEPMGFEPIGQGGNRFTGTVSGAGHTIANLYISRPTENHIGLFGNANGAVISNLGMVHNDITGAQMVGGIAGNAYETSVSGCFATGTVTGDYSVGGIVGYNNGLSSVKNCYATGAVTGTGSVGGVVGQNTALSENEVLYCYSTGVVTGTENSGGFVGKNDNATVDSCFWDTETSGLSTSNGGTAATTTELQTLTTFTDAGWDFVGETTNGTEGVWVFLEGDYPHLTWETEFPEKGSGSELNPYQITTVEELQAMKYDLAGNYRIMNDIDASATSSWNGGLGFEPIGNRSSYFTGSLNGGGHRVIELKISDMSLGCAGLIGAADKAQIDSLGVEGTYAAGDYVGGIVGYVHTDTRISNCYTEVHMLADSKVGGIAGGMFDSDTVINCYAAGSIAGGSSSVGGLVGLVSVGEVINSYSTSTLTGGSNIHGLIGSPNIVVPVNCFWDSTICAPAASGDVGPPMNSNDLKTGSTFTDAGWDFDKIWVIDEGDDYPKLAWSVVKLNYSANEYGSVDDEVQYLFAGTDGSPVTATPNSGCRFIMWDDGSSENPRTDLNVSSDFTVEAKFGQVSVKTTTVDSIRVTTSVELSRDSTIAPQTDTIVTIISEITLTDSLWIRTDSVVDGESFWNATEIVVNVRSKEETSYDSLSYFPTITVAVDSSHSILKDTTTSVDSSYSGKSDTIVTTVKTENWIDSLFVRTDSLSDGLSFWFHIDTSVTSGSSVFETQFDTLKYIPTTTVTVDSTHSIIKDTITSVDSSYSKSDTIVTTIKTENWIDSLFVRTDSLSDGVSFWFHIDTSITSGSSAIETKFDTLEYNETLTTVKKNNTISTIVKEDSLEIDSLVGPTDEEDTIVTTTTLTVYSDSLFVITDSLLDGEWFNADTLFSSEEFRNDTISIKVDTLTYQGGSVAIFHPSEGLKTSPFDIPIAPNPVPSYGEQVSIDIPKGDGWYSIVILDEVGNQLFTRTGNLSENTIVWNLRNKNSQRITGSALVILKTELQGGTVKWYRSVIGVQK